MNTQDKKRAPALTAQAQTAQAAARGGDGPELTALPYRVKRLAALVGIYVDRALREHGLGRSQWQVLSCLAKAGELSQRQLQSALLVEPATLTGIVDVLAEKGWVDRTEGTEDRRVRMVRMTSAGMRRFSTIENPVERVATLILKGVNGAEQERFSRALARMITNLESENVRRCNAGQDSCNPNAKD